MRGRRRLTACAVAMLACLAGEVVAQPGQRTGELEPDYLTPLRAASCPKGVTKTDAEAVPLTATSVPLQGVNPSRKTLGDLTFVAGFHLTSSDKRFGGLSGIDLLENGNLLAISDQGDFVWLDLAEDGVTPVRARIGGMHDAAADPLHGKSDADSEGLAYQDGLALVSFEGGHRVLAFNLAACGANARGAPITFGPFGSDMSAAFARQGLKVGGNTGLEGLAITPDWFLFAGLESRAENASPLSARALEDGPEFDLTIGQDMPPVVGLDILPDGDDLRVFSLHRSTNALASNVISLVETHFRRSIDQSRLPANRISEIEHRTHERFKPDASRMLAQMNVFVTLDNFEGVAARELPDGRVRLYVISDDNFSKKQRTLLMIYDVRKPG
ncbi:MAG: esterase-like activity of phytase family protein [Hyphomonadaceae bacterium]